ncbi:MAG: phosphoribosyltransferase, partial [Cytophagales bacterium]|nr:phosphoribosyltransferase [Cytophagales bacterium]
SEITLDTELKTLKKKVVILVDDVLNSGRTMVYSLKPFLNIEIKKLQTATLVDRNHKTFPIKADYVGYSLSTTLQDHINVSFEGDEILVYLH